jgi:hypothetical protein
MSREEEEYKGWDTGPYVAHLQMRLITTMMTGGQIYTLIFQEYFNYWLSTRVPVRASTRHYGQYHIHRARS